MSWGKLTATPGQMLTRYSCLPLNYDPITEYPALSASDWPHFIGRFPSTALSLIFPNVALPSFTTSRNTSKPILLTSQNLFVFPPWIASFSPCPVSSHLHLWCYFNCFYSPLRYASNPSHIRMVLGSLTSLSLPHITVRLGHPNHSSTTYCFQTSCYNEQSFNLHSLSPYQRYSLRNLRGSRLYVSLWTPGIILTSGLANLWSQPSPLKTYIENCISAASWAHYFWYWFPPLPHYLYVTLLFIYLHLLSADRLATIRIPQTFTTTSVSPTYLLGARDFWHTSTLNISSFT